MGAYSEVSESWTVAGDCDGGYLKVYDEQKRVKFLKLTPRMDLFSCPFGAACRKTTVGTGLLRPSLDIGASLGRRRLVFAQVPSKDSLQHNWMQLSIHGPSVCYV